MFGVFARACSNLMGLCVLNLKAKVCNSSQAMMFENFSVESNESKHSGGGQLGFLNPIKDHSSDFRSFKDKITF